MNDGTPDARFEARRQRIEERRRMLAAGPPSPCVSICRLDEAAGWCAGCYRTIDEIRDWIIMTPVERHAVLARVAERRSAGRR
jgi:hypothetical protein